MKNYSIGLDFGTLSARAVLVDISNGDEIAVSTFDYPNGVINNPINFDLQDPSDYIESLKFIIPDVLQKSKVSADNVVGVGVDFTACTMLPVYKDGTPLFYNHPNDPHAYAKLWKHHAAEPYAVIMNEIAAERNEPWLARYGGKISSEWLFPKILQIKSEAPEIYDQADYFIEAVDWLVWQLCGRQTRNSCCAGYKALWNKKTGYPSNDYFKAVGLDNIVSDKLDCPITSIGSKAGGITTEAAAMTGLKPGTAIAVAVIDAHASLPALGVTDPGKLFLIMGTSGCHLILGDKETIIPGICGVVEDGMIPGYFGYEAGQACFGDHFAWFVNNFGFDFNEIAQKAAHLKPGESGILALDWWNGNRSVLVDYDLTGLFIGMNLQTKPEELYRALIEATAFGTRKIIDTFKEYNVFSNEIYAAGGIAEKDPFIMQLFADVLGLDIKTSGSPQSGALGSAIFGAAAAGCGSIGELSQKMCKLGNIVYKHNPDNKKIYDQLYAEYEILHDYFGKGGNDVMKRLKKIQRDI